MVDKNGREIIEGQIIKLVVSPDHFLEDIYALYKRGQFTRLEPSEDITALLCKEIIEVVG